MIHIVGYLALILNLFSMTMSKVLVLRIISLIANIIYVIYGLLLKAPPLVFGCSIAVLIHIYHIFKLINKSNKLKVIS